MSPFFVSSVGRVLTTVLVLGRLPLTELNSEAALPLLLILTRFDMLTELDLSGNALGTKAFLFLNQLRYAPRQRCRRCFFTLNFCVDDAFVDELCRLCQGPATLLARINRLNVAGNLLTAGTFWQMLPLYLPLLTHFTFLRFPFHLPTASVRSLATTFERQALPPSLQHLDLSGNPLGGDAGAAALALLQRCPMLETLVLDDTGIRWRETDAMEPAPLIGLPNLRVLRAGRTAWTTAEAFAAVVAHPWLRQLAVLSLAGATATSAAAWSAILRALRHVAGCVPNLEAAGSRFDDVDAASSKRRAYGAAL